MFTHLKHAQIDKSKWDQCIGNAANAVVYAQSWYLDIVSPHWEALIIDDYKIVFPVTVKQKFYINYLCNPYFVQQLGLFSKHEISHEIYVELLEWLKKSYPLIEINFNSSNQIDATFKGIKYLQNYKLILDQPAAILFENYKGNCRRNIRLAHKNNLEIKFKADVNAIIDLFKNNKGKIYTRIKKPQYNCFLALFIKANAQIKTESIACYNHKNEMIAGAIFFIYKNNITYVFSGINNEGRKKSAMFIIFEALIKNYTSQNFILDFEGGNSDGMASFYAGFGATSIPFPQFKKAAWPLSLFK